MGMLRRMAPPQFMGMLRRMAPPHSWGGGAEGAGGGMLRRMAPPHSWGGGAEGAGGESCVAWLLPIHGDVASHGSSPFMGRWRRRRRRGWCDLVICAVRGLFRPRSARTASVDLRQLVAAVLFLGVGAACQSAATATPTPSPVGLVNSSPLCRGVHLLADRQRMDLAIYTWQRTGTGYRPATHGLVGSRAVAAVIERPQ